MRNTTRHALLATFVALSACGGNGTGPSDPVATSLAVSAGSGQSAAVGTAVAVAPAVTVKDQRGNGLAGVVVTFAVASGGGSLTGDVVDTTDAGGVARTGGWTLGTQTGSNTLTATVVGLTPITIAATATAGTPAALVFVTTPPATAQSGVAFSTQPSLQVKDQFGNAVPQAGVAVTAVITTGGGTLGGTATVNTNASGVATFTNLAITGAIGSRTLSFSTTGLPSLLSGGIQLNAGAAASLTAVGATTLSGTAGLVVGVPIAVTVADQSGNPVAGATVTFAVTAGGGSVTGAVPVSDAFGLATVGSWTLGSVAGTLNTLSASTGSLSPVVFSVTPAAGSATRLVVTTQPGGTTAINGAALTPQPALQVSDAFGNAVAQGGVAVTAAIASGGGVLGGTLTVSTSAGGVATFSGLSITGTAGAHTLGFSATGLTSATSASFTLTTGAATTIAVNAGNSQTGTVGAAVTTAPSVLVTDQSGNAVSGIAVTFAVASGGGSATGTSTTTSASGVATIGSWTLGTTAGPNTLTATSTGLTGSPITFTATGTPAPASQLTITTQPSSNATNGIALAQQPVLQLCDSFGNAVSQAGLSVTATASSGGSLVGTSTVSTNASGQASFTNLVLNGLLGSYTISFTSTGLTGATSTSISLVAGAASQLALTTQPSTSVINGNTLAQQPVAQLRDAGGNPVSSAGVTVVIGVTGNPAGVALGGTTATATNASGTATFTNLSLTGLVGNYTLSVSASGVTAATSVSIGLLAGAATTVAINTGNGQTATVNTLLPIAPSVVVTDQSGNLVSGKTVTFAVATGGGSATGTSAVSGSNGIATVGSWTIGSVAGSNTLTATASGLSGSPLTFTATGTPAAATKLTITTQPSASATNGVVLAQQPVLQLQDAFSNNVSQAGVSITATASAGGTLVGTTVVATNASGQASFSGLRLNGLVGNYTLGFTSAGLTGATSTPIALGVGAASQLVVTTQPSATVINGGVLAQQPVIQLRDAGGNNVSTALVNVVATLTGAPAGVTLGGSTTIPTSGTGVSTFTNLSLTGVVGSYTLTFTSTGLTSAVSTAIALQAGAGVSLTANSVQTQSGRVGIAVTTLPSVKLRDASGNPVSGATVTFAVTTGGGSLTGATTTTDALGIATVGNWIYGKQVLTNTVTATSGALPLVSFDASPAFIPGRVTTGAAHSCALSVDGVAYCWGANSSGALGDSTTGQRLSPTAVKSTQLFTSITGGQAHSCAFTGSGAAACWGANNRGQLGVNNIVTQLVPVSVSGPGGSGSVAFSAIELGFDHSCGISTTFFLYCWGGNNNGQLGNGVTSTGNRTTPLQITGGFLQVSAGFSYSCGVRTTAVGDCWGFNGFAQLGDSTKSQRTNPTLIKGGLAFAEVVSSQTHSCGRTTAGLVYCWGLNLNGRIGQDTLSLPGNESVVPLQVAGLSSVAQVVVGGGHSCARTSAGQVSCWGLNDGGQIGDNSLTNRVAPTAVVLPSGVTSFTSVTAGSAHTCGLGNDQKVYCWGDGNSGQLGNGGTADQLVPTQIIDP